MWRYEPSWVKTGWKGGKYSNGIELLVSVKFGNFFNYWRRNFYYEMSYRKFLTFMPRSRNQVHVLPSGSADLSPMVQATIMFKPLLQGYSLLNYTQCNRFDIADYWWLFGSLNIHHNLCSKRPSTSWTYTLQWRRTEPRKLTSRLGRFLMSAVAILNFYVIKFRLQASSQIII
jgi:hypothetical protein